MNTKPLEQFAQAARRDLLAQVTARLDFVLHTDSAELRAQADAIEALQSQIRAHGREAVIDRAAYTWFNRFCALRFMDANDYHAPRVVSPAAGDTQPEILQEAKAGHSDPSLPVDRQRVLDLLAGRVPSRDGQGEAYRLLLVAACNRAQREMPFLFEPIADWTELLLPDDLLSPRAVPAAARAALTEEICRDVEAIGWLYQFYISERKDAVIGSKQKIEAADIPAATQLFTPHWIVRYLVENSLGRLWLLNKPNSRLAEQMEYYVPPDGDALSPATRHAPLVTSPEELRLCDPACGSGHMLTYAFDLLYAIYEEEGYNPPDIPRLILQHNLTGLEIDERAADLAAFALMMKARARDRRFFGRGVAPRIVVVRPPRVDRDELARVGWFRGLGTTLLDRPLQEALLTDLHALEQAGNLGALIRPRLTSEQIEELRRRVTAADNLLTHQLNSRVLAALDQLAALARPYHVVVANPPYMGSGNMNDALKQFLNAEYKEFKADLFSAFTVRIMEMVPKGGFIGMMTPFNWMFLSSFEKLRDKILEEYTLTNLVRPEFHAFFDSAFVSICAFTLYTQPLPEYEGAFIHLQAFYGADVQPVKALEAIRNPDCGWFYRASAADFKKLPGSPIAYDTSETVRNLFAEAGSLSSLVIPKMGMRTGDNERFLRLWHEVSITACGFGMKDAKKAQRSGRRWFPIHKGGGYRRWYGNNEFLVNWYNDGYEIKVNTLENYPQLSWDNLGWKISNEQDFFKTCFVWTRISSSYLGVRYSYPGFIFDTAGCAGFPTQELDALFFTALLCSSPSSVFARLLNPTMAYQPRDIGLLPIPRDVEKLKHKIESGSLRAIQYAKSDWDAYETSWDFTTLPLLRPAHRRETLAATYAALRQTWQAMTLEMQRLEEENNRLFIDAYGLQDELTPDVPLREITLTCNPHYRYGDSYSDDALEARLLADTLREFISYGVGCLFGRYSLDRPGLVLADAGATVDDYLRRVPNPTLAPDHDGVLPILDGDWFADDVVGGFKRFLRVTFGDAHYAANLAFIESALGREIRSYFLRDFYDHHVRTYKKRPIYWLFSSPGGTFNALIYLHRYRPDTVSVVLNHYLRDYRTKLESQREHLRQVSVSGTASAREKTQALRELDRLEKTLAELRAYESDVLYPLATRRVALDLDDGVKVNYNKLGRALKKVVGLSE